MVERTKEEQIKRLESKIKNHNYAYWKRNKPLISDIEYDELVNELIKYDPTNSLITKIESPKVKQKLKREKYVHTEPMLSLNKVYTKTELVKWCENVSRNADEVFLFQPKLDGISGSFKDKILSTRGNGNIGENISNKIPIIKYFGQDAEFLPLTELENEVRGELIITESTFDIFKNKLLRSDGQEYKTARGLCSGLLMKETTNTLIDNIIHFVNFNKFTEELKIDDIKEINIHNTQLQLSEMNYQTDGFVVKLKDEIYSKQLGFTSHHPKGQMAFKFNNSFKESILLDIEWSVGKHTITPIGIIKPVNINNSIIKRVSLHNGKFILDHDLKIGDNVTVEKAGDIIPHIKGTSPGEDRKDIYIEKCPQCGEAIEYVEPEIVCNNTECLGSNVRKLYDSIIRIGIENIGPSITEKLYNINKRCLLDIFTVTKKELKKLPNFKQKSIDNLYDEIQKVQINNIDDWQLLSCLNLKGIGTTLSKTLLKEFTLKELKDKSKDDLTLIDGIGEERARELYEGLVINESFITTLSSFFKGVNVSKNQKVKGKVCFTGKGNFPRNYYTKMATRDGYLVTSSVTKDLTFLVTDNVNGKGSKMKKAGKNNIPILTYNQIEESK